MKNTALQIMDITSLKAVLSDLRTKIIPSRLEKVQQLNSHTLQIAFRTLDKLIWLEISWHADSSRIVEIKSPPKINGESTLSKQIKSGANGLALTKIRQEGFNRVVEFQFALRPKEDTQRFLILEIMGRHSNLILLNNKKQVITLGKQVRDNQSRLRPISTGDLYSPPPSLSGREPNKTDSLAIWKQNLSVTPLTLGKALNQTFQGISPSLSLQLADDDKETAQRLVNLPITELTEENWSTLFTRWSKWLKDIESENFCLCFDGPSPYRVWKIENLINNSNKEVSLGLGKYYQKGLEDLKLIRTYQTMEKQLSKIKKSEEYSLNYQEELLKNIDSINQLRVEADSLLSSLNPNKKDIKKAQSLYSKAKKIKRSEAFLIKRINHHKDKLLFINEVEFFLKEIMYNNFDSESQKAQIILNLNEDLENYIFTKKQQKQRRKRSANLNTPNILKIKSPNGFEIQVGRNQRQNDFISIKKARKGDIWFHAQECPGSHVVIKASHGNPEEIDLEIGADLAAFFSKARKNKKVSVLMAPSKQLNKLKGTAPGMVSPRKSTVLWGKPSNGQNYFLQSTKRAENELSSDSTSKV